MAKRSEPGPKESAARVLRALEVELAKATERFRIAKLAAKQAKAEAKVAKKDMKHARTALGAAQDEHDKALSISSKEKAGTPRKRTRSKGASRVAHGRVAGTPENTRKPASDPNPDRDAPTTGVELADGSSLATPDPVTMTTARVHPDD